ncbi:hypothetical protein [Candidatus Villigracilis affinis]|uniref:hypothetical protein n=1 Tax=Candidatus Villigracilis affinis TaxID=3140682 RepID=UPI001DF6881A|nr:hypothetical protein [Anaerolineales bacterium]
MTQSNRFFITIVFLLVAVIAINPPVDNDMWWHLRAGDEMWHQGKILLTDQFSYTKYGEDWVNAFWISDLALYGLWKVGGFFAITLTVSLLAAAVLWIVFKQMTGTIILRGLLVILAMMGMIANWTPRPQLLSFLLLAWLDSFLNQHINFKRQPLWALVILFALWGNLHGGFIWGALLLLATLAGETFNNLLGNQPKLSYREIGSLGGWSAIGLLAVSINPNGFELWKLPFQQVDVSLAIQEWLSPDFHQLYAHPMLWLLFLLIFGLAFAEKRISFTDLFKGLGFAYLFFFAQRNLVAYTIIILPIVEKFLSPALANLAAAPEVKTFLERFSKQTSEKQLPPKVAAVINNSLTGLFVVLLLGYAWAVSIPESIAKEVPAQATAWIKQNQPRGPIFNSYNWGGYLTWELREYPVFIDGRADLYGNEMIQEWVHISEGTEKGLALLESHQINLIYLEPYQALLGKLDPQQWEMVYGDSKIVIYQRRQ